MESNPEGLLESRAAHRGGIRNQVWEDSPIAYDHADGRLADERRGIAFVEVQALVHDALLGSAELLRSPRGRRSADPWLAGECEAGPGAAKLIDGVLWARDGRGPYVVLGTDRDEGGELRPLQVRTSNMGHLLTSRLLDGDEGPERTEAIADALGEDGLRAAAGVRTLSADAVRYRPGGYHVGSVGPWENELIARGLRRFGRTDQAADLEARVLASCRTTGMFPEFLRGEPDRIAVNTRVVDAADPDVGIDRAEQPPQQVQAWTVAGVLAIEHRRRQQRLAAAA